MGEWNGFVDKEREEELEQIIAEERLKPHETRDFIETAFRDIENHGNRYRQDHASCVPLWGSGRAAKKQTVIEKLKAFFEKYFGIGTMFKRRKIDGEEA